MTQTITKPVHVQQQFEDMEQQTHSATLGMWTFLATEVLFFGALFVGYAVYRTRWPDEFREASRELKLWIGGVNAFLLLVSSLTMALAVRSAAIGNNRGLVLHLSLTVGLAVMFLGFKATEYTLEAREHLIPNVNFTTVPPEDAQKPPAEQRHRPDQQQLFMGFYFIMTGLHALHVTVGIGVLAVLIVFARRGHFSPAYHNPVEVAGLYWHFVDIVWVFLYPALYLLRQG
jgi:cytochrome c oxidase subunit 3